MIKIIGTNHLMSKEAIEGIIKDYSPEVIGVELCQTRFKVFTNQIKQNAEEDKSLLGEIAKETKKKAEESNLDYGSDMKTAMFYAINNNLKLELLDKDIIKIKEEMSYIPLGEQIYLQKELMKFKEEGFKEIDEDELIKTMKEKIPTIHKILVKDRDEFILNKIKQAIEKYPNKRILVFIGKGHVNKIIGGLK